MHHSTWIPPTRHAKAVLLIAPLALVPLNALDAMMVSSCFPMVHVQPHVLLTLTEMVMTANHATSHVQHATPPHHPIASHVPTSTIFISMDRAFKAALLDTKSLQI